MKVRFVDRVVYWCARLALAVAARVPQWLGYGFAALLGRAFFACDRRRRGYALHLLKNAFPERGEPELLRIGAAATANLFKVPLDMARLTRLLARGGDLHGVVDGAADLARLVGTKPLFGLTGHLGNWEVAAAAMAQHLGGAYVVARVSKNPLLQQWILGNRERCGLHILPRRGGIKDLAAAMGRGAVGLQAVDQNQRLRGVFAPFFGQVASCERAAVSLALRRGYPITVGAALRIGSGFRFKFECCEPFVLERTGDKRQDLYNAVVKVNQHLEALIRRSPEQYLWIHDRYRTKPPPGAEAVAGDDDALDEGT